MSFGFRQRVVSKNSDVEHMRGDGILMNDQNRTLRKKLFNLSEKEVESRGFRFVANG